MNEQAIICAARIRAQDPATRTDWAERERVELAAPATLEQIVQAEAALGCRFHEFHRKLLQEVGNGGFGPGDGLIGIPGGRTDDEGRSILELRQALFGNQIGNTVPRWVVPLCDWGDGAWSCLDESTGNVLMLDEHGLTDTSISLQSWMNDWVSGVDLAEKLFAFEERVGINPFTREPMTVRLRGRPVGRPYRVMVG